MRSKLIFALCFISAVVAVNAQETSKIDYLPESKDFSFVSEKAKERSLNAPNRQNASEPVQTSSAQSSVYSRPNAECRFKRYVNSVVGPFALVGTAFGAGISTAANEPEEWGKK